MPDEASQQTVKWKDLALRWKVGVIGMIAAVGVNLGFGVTESGLFPIVIDLQHRLIGGHFTGVTFLVCLVPLLVPVLLLRDPLARLLRRLGVHDPGESAP